MKLTGQVLATDELSSEDRRQMLRLMQRHYAAVDPIAFADDLAEKQWVIQVRDARDGNLCGFSTQVLLESEREGKPLRALFSGDTIIDREHWGDQALTQAWGRLALTLIDQWGDDGDLFWFLISQGYKTYRFLPIFFHEFYPRYDHSTPSARQDVLSHFAAQKYPLDYDAHAGIVRANARQYRLRAGVAELTAARLRDPHVKHFAALNPGHAQGDELCCLAPLSRANFTAAAYRVIGLDWAAARAS